MPLSGVTFIQATIIAGTNRFSTDDSLLYIFAVPVIGDFRLCYRKVGDEEIQLAIASYVHSLPLHYNCGSDLCCCSVSLSACLRALCGSLRL